MPMVPALRQVKGFTLIELMLVMVLISIMVGLFALNVSHSPQQVIEREARRLQAILLLAADEAVMQGVELGLSLPTRAYQIIRFDTEALKWKAVDEKSGDNAGFIQYELPEFVYIELQLDDKNMDDEQRQQIDRIKRRVNSDIPPPVILMLSSGELSPFKLRFYHEAVEYSASIVSDGFSGIELRL